MKISKLLSAFAAISLLSVVGTASAAGVYAGASVGTTNYGGGATGTETGGKVFAGYQFTPNLGVEGSLFALGSHNSVESKGLAADVVGTLPLTSRFDVFGKVGVADMKLDGAANTGYQLGSHYGVGASYALTQKVSVRVEAERFQKAGDATGATPRANLYSAGLQYKF